MDHEPPVRPGDPWIAFAQAEVELQRSIEESMRLIVAVLRGPDSELRDEAIDELEALADEVARSTARLEELR